MKELNIKLKFLEWGRKNKYYLKFFIEFKTEYYIIVFVFDVFIYFISFILFSIFFYFYFYDIKLYSIVKNNFIELYGLVIFLQIKNILIFSFIIFIILLLIALYKYKTKEEIIKIIYTFIYHRLNFLINYYIFIKIFGINTFDYIEYNFLIIVLFFLILLLKIIFSLLNNKINIEIKHYLGFPFLSIFYWIWLYKHISDVKLFRFLYDDFVGYDDKYYEIIYIDKTKNN